MVEGSPSIPAERTIDLDGKVLMAGWIDSHVHFQEPGRPHWEKYRKASKAAAAGGVTAFIDMPLDSTPSTVNRANLQLKRDTVKTETVVDYAQWAGLVDNNLDELDALHRAGVVGFKAFMVETGIEDFKRVDDDVLYEGLLRSREYGSVVGVHAENDALTRHLAEKLQAAGRKDRRAFLDSRPPETELEAIQRAALWAKATGGNLHVVHVTIAGGIDAVNHARQGGAHVTCETCPTYLFFDEDDFIRMGPILKAGPPVRARAEVERLWQRVLDGQVDVIGSDHSPSTWAEKEIGMDDIWLAWGGMCGVQTLLPVMITEGVLKRGLGLPALTRMVSANPARIFGLADKGRIAPGMDADLTVIDLDGEWTVTPESLYYENQFSPYVGYTLKGKVLWTLVRGVVVFGEGKIQVQPGFGQLLKRQQPWAFQP